MATTDLVMSSDTQLVSDAVTTNYESNISIGIGESNATARIIRAIIKPDFSPVSGAIISAATLKLTPMIDFSDNARTLYAHRVLRSVNTTQATWNVYSTGNNWGTAGCSNSTTDYDGAVVLGSTTQPASPTIDSPGFVSMTLDVAEIQKFNDGTYANNGIVLFVDTQNNDEIIYHSKESTTSAYRPIITVTYSIPKNHFFAMIKNRRNKRKLTYG